MDQLHPPQQNYNIISIYMKAYLHWWKRSTNLHFFGTKLHELMQGHQENSGNHWNFFLKLSLQDVILEKWWHYVWGKGRSILGWSENQFVIKFYHLQTPFVSKEESLHLSGTWGENFALNWNQIVIDNWKQYSLSCFLYYQILFTFIYSWQRVFQFCGVGGLVIIHTRT